MDKQAQYVKQIEDTLYALLPEQSISSVCRAMAYAVRGGKRVRGVLTLAFSQLLGANMDYALCAACAIEMVHAYSLVHDDLPCMDNDDQRRGMPSTHKAFGEATALLAGDALLTKAFETLSGISDSCVASRCVRTLSKAAGSEGMVYGQELDLLYETVQADKAALELIHANKTGKLFCACAELAADCAKTEADWAVEAAANLGLTFQIIDDILDSAQDSADNAEDTSKATYVSLYGTERSRQLAGELTRAFTLLIQQNAPAGCEFLCDYANALLKRVF